MASGDMKFFRMKMGPVAPVGRPAFGTHADAQTARASVCRTQLERDRNSPLARLSISTSVSVGRRTTMRTSNALRDALAESERLRSDAADLRHATFDKGLSNLPAASIAGATDWLMKFLERKRALTGAGKARFGTQNQH